MSMDIEQFSYFSKLVALIDLYVELSLPLVAALRAAEADLGSWRDESSWLFPDPLVGGLDQVVPLRRLGRS
jgi:hypothetical protein